MVKIVASGDVTGPAGYPSVVFEEALAAVRRLHPGFEMNQRIKGCSAFPVLRMRRERKRKVAV